MADRDLLSGIDGPRPLPDGLRHRLEDRMLHDRPRALDADLAGRLSDTLTRPVPGRGHHRLWDRRTRLAGGLAAAVLLVAGGIGLAVDRSGPPNPVSTASGTTATGPGAVPGIEPTAGASAGSAAGVGSAGPASAGRAPGGPFPAAGPTGAPSSPEAQAVPSVRAVTPDRGPAGGGTWVTIEGDGLGPVTQVRFGGSPAARLTVLSPTSVRALTPPHPAGPVRVEVVTPTGSGYGTFTYTAG